MAAENKTVKTNYYLVRDHKFVKAVKEPTPTSFEREYEGKKYYEERYNRISGRIIGFNIWDEQPSDPAKKPIKMLAVNLWDEEAKVKECIQMYFEGNGAYTLFNRLFNVDFSKDVIIHMRKIERKKNGIPTGTYKDLTCIYQIVNGDEILIPSQFTKDNNTSAYGSLPPAEQVGTEKNPSWNFAKQQEFIENIFTLLNEKLRSMYEEARKASNTDTVANNETETEVSNESTNYTEEIEQFAAEQKEEIEKQEAESKQQNVSKSRKKK